MVLFSFFSPHDVIDNLVYRYVEYATREYKILTVISLAAGPQHHGEREKQLVRFLPAGTCVFVLTRRLAFTISAGTSDK